METSPLARRMAGRFAAGDTLSSASAVSRRLNREGILVTLDHLGENTTSLEEAEAFRDMYLQVLTEIKEAGIQGNISLKLTQLGLDVSESACRENVELLVRRAAGWATSSAWTWNRAATPTARWRWCANCTRGTVRWAQ